MIYYTKAAIELAKANNVELWNRDQLVKALLSIKNDGSIREPELEMAITQDQSLGTENNVCI